MIVDTTDWFAPEKVRQRAAELDAVPEAAVSTDLRPIVYMHRLALWEKMTAAHSHRFIERLLVVKWWQAAVVLAVAALAGEKRQLDAAPVQATDQEARRHEHPVMPEGDEHRSGLRDQLIVDGPAADDAHAPGASEHVDQ